ncbi:MAG: mechanosensitive ion channel family protein [Planctomycetota bacterium]
MQATEPIPAIDEPTWQSAADGLMPGPDAVPLPLAESAWGLPSFSTWLGTAWVHALLGAFIALILAVVLYRACRKLIGRFAEHRPEFKEMEPTLVVAFRWIYVPIAVLFILQQIGVSPGSLWTVLSAGLAMIAIGFVAVWSVLSNVSAAVMILFTRMFRIGDDVELIEPTGESGPRGVVSNNNLVYTTIRQRSAHGGEVRLHVPNNIFFQKALRVRTGPAKQAEMPLLDRPADPTPTPASGGGLVDDAGGGAAALLAADAQRRGSGDTGAEQTGEAEAGPR